MYLLVSHVRSPFALFLPSYPTTTRPALRFRKGSRPTSYIFTISCSLNWKQLWTLFFPLLFCSLPHFVPSFAFSVFHMCEKRTQQSVTVSVPSTKSEDMLCVVCSSLENSITRSALDDAMLLLPLFYAVDSCMSRKICVIYIFRK